MITGNEPAMPADWLNKESGNVEYTGGLTIRQEFAKAAMQGMVASGWNDEHSELAKRSVEIANALINELNKNQTT